MALKDDRSSGGSKRKVPIRFFSRKTAPEEEAGESQSTPLDPVSPGERDNVFDEPESLMELDRAIDASCEELAKDDSIDPAPARLATDLERENAELQNRLLRLAAEFENYRKRVERDRLLTLERTRGEIIESLLPVIDNYQLALRTARTEGGSPKLLAGLEQISRQLEALLTSFDVHPIDTAGKTFDPTLHEATATSTRDDLPESTIIEEYQRGYRIGDQLLRPARVKVTSR